MNEPMNILIEILEEIKQQNRELKASLTSLPTATPQPSECTQQAHIEGLAQKLEQQIRHNNEFKEELVRVLTKLGRRIHEMRSDIAEVRTAQDETTSKLIDEMQAKQSPPEVKVSQYYLFDAKRWAEWIVWGVMVTALAYVMGWAAHLYGLNRSLERQTLCYRALRMELGYRHPRVAELDSLLAAEDSDRDISKLRESVTTYEFALKRQAELQLQKQRLDEEQASLSRQPQH